MLKKLTHLIDAIAALKEIADRSRDYSAAHPEQTHSYEIEMIARNALNTKGAKQP